MDSHYQVRHGCSKFWWITHKFVCTVMEVNKYMSLQLLLSKHVEDDKHSHELSRQFVFKVQPSFTLMSCRSTSWQRELASSACHRECYQPLWACLNQTSISETNGATRWLNSGSRSHHYQPSNASHVQQLIVRTGSGQMQHQQPIAMVWSNPINHTMESYPVAHWPNRLMMAFCILHLSSSLMNEFHRDARLKQNFRDAVYHMLH